MTLVIFSLLVVGALLWVELILRSDRRWYKNHPGAEKKFGEIDDELISQGR
jgi:hypothetical protein